MLEGATTGRQASAMTTQAPSLIEALQDPALYDHPVEYFRLVETHISWVLLTGQYVYKIKKAVDLGFVDFSTPELRRRYCEDEVRLNRRLAPRLYLGVVPLSGTPSRPQLGGDAEAAFEYAVKMRQFDPDNQFDRLMRAGRLTADHIDRLARTVSRFHDAIERASPDDPRGAPDAVHRAVIECFEQIERLSPDDPHRLRLQRLRTWCETTRHALAPQLHERKAGGFIRECHGDLHLANITLYGDEVTAFDCLEFNEALRWIDTISEIAFLIMDLDAHHAGALGNRFLNAYLHDNGDYEGLRVLRYYQVYRALVRAKVAYIRNTQSPADAADEGRHIRTYLALADRYTRDAAGAVIITHGLSGSGKTTVTAPLAERCGAIRIRSDVERKRLFGMAPEARPDPRSGVELYSSDASARTYERLAGLTRDVVRSGYPVIVDAAFLRRSERGHFCDLATRLQVPFVILDFNAPQHLLRQWITERAREGSDASDADVAVLEHQIRTREPLEDGERAASIAVDTGTTVDVRALAETLRRMME